MAIIKLRDTRNRYLLSEVPLEVLQGGGFTILLVGIAALLCW